MNKLASSATQLDKQQYLPFSGHFPEDFILGFGGAFQF